MFSNVTSPSTKAKLRILFEVAPLGLLVSAFRMQNLHSSLAAACFCACCDTITCRYICSSDRMFSAHQGFVLPTERLIRCRSHCWFV